MTVDTWIKIWRGGFAVSFFGATQFLVCVFLSMILYTGGNVENRHAPNYDVSQNFASDIGRTISLSGNDNLTGSRIFNGSLIVFGFCQLPFFLFMPMQAWDRPGMLRVAAVIGAVSSMGLVVMGCYPADLFPGRHHLALFVWVVGVFFSSSLHALALLTSRENESLLMPLISVGVAMLAIAWVISATETAAAFALHRNSVPLQSVLLEKLVFLAVMAWYLAFSARMILTTDFSEYRERQLAIDAEDYLNRISSEPLRQSERQFPVQDDHS